MSTARRLSLVWLASLLLPAVASGANPAMAVPAPSFTVPSGVDVVEIEVSGGRGGNSVYIINYSGGQGCRVRTPLGVSPGDSVNWILGEDGGSITLNTATTGALGGGGARSGGNGGNSTGNDGTGAAGAGGGGASAVTLNGIEMIVAAGGGGASRSGGGKGCASYTAAGGSGFGAVPTARGATDPAAGGAGGLGTSGSGSPVAGQDGQSATGTPPGRGGDGASVTLFRGVAGGGGGGGISGGGGGSGTDAFGGNGAGTGGAGLSGVTTSVTQTGFLPPTYVAAGDVASYVRINTVNITTTTLPAATAGVAYSAQLAATFTEAFTTAASAGTPTGDISWSLAAGSPSLPGGLNLATTGAISGVPVTGGTVTVILSASVLEDYSGSLPVPLVRARSVVSLTIEVAPGNSTVVPPPPPTTVIPATTTTVPTSESPETSLPSESVAPETTTPPSTSDVPTPVTIGGDLPRVSAGDTLVVEAGEPIDVNVFTEDESLVLESDRFELRLRGDCSRDACIIDTTDEGREILTLEEAGRANVDGLGFLPGSIVDIWLFSEPRYLGSLAVAPDGTFIGDVDLVGIVVGEHTLQVNGLSQAGAQRSANLGVIVNPTVSRLPSTGREGDRTIPMAVLLTAVGLLALVARRRQIAN